MNKRLQCPDCQRPLREVVHHDVHVDVCDCGGMWFDRGELETWRRASKGQRQGGKAADLERNAKALPCPGCASMDLRARSLDTIACARCERCGGVWLPGNAVALLAPSRPQGTDSGIATAVFDAVFQSLAAFPW